MRRIRLIYWLLLLIKCWNAVRIHVTTRYYRNISRSKNNIPKRNGVAAIHSSVIIACYCYVHPCSIHLHLAFWVNINPWIHFQSEHTALGTRLLLLFPLAIGGTDLKSSASDRPQQPVNMVIGDCLEWLRFILSLNRCWTNNARNPSSYQLLQKHCV